jgi:hypothetical protein
MNKSAKSRKPTIPKAAGLFAASLLVAAVLAFFARSFFPDYVVFSNDGPLGLQKAAWLHLPQAFLGQWYDLNSVGTSAASSLPDFTSVIRWCIGPTGYAKLGAPISLWILGFGAYFCFRRFGTAIMPSLLAGLAACLSTGYFTNACWGAAPPVIAFGMDFVALGVLAKRDKFPFWIAPALAGMAVGLNVMEAADIGALFSMLIAAFVMYQALTEDGSPVLARVGWGVGRTLIVAVFACFIAAHAVSMLVGTSIKGIVGTEQDEKTKAERWDFATSWSVPKRETLALVVPNLFGCTVMTPGAANYWGGMGTDPEWDRYFASNEQGSPPQPGHFLRHTGRGIYLGAFVVLVGAWTVMQSFRRKDSVFTIAEKKLIWFWFAVAIIGLLLAFGRFAPFYRLVYKLPYFSTIRNPEKFLHFVSFSSVFLFAYGVHALHRLYINVPLVAAPSGRLKAWWAKAKAFDRRWVVGTFCVLVLSLVAWGLYASMRGQVEDHLVKLQRLDSLRNGRELDAAALNGAHDFAASQVSYSLRQVGWCVLVLTLGSGLLLLIFSGAFAGRRARWAGIFLGIILVGDLGRANWPYIVYWNYKEKYEVGHPEPVIDFLAKKPYEHRVAYLLPPPLYTPDAFAYFHQLYEIEWKQQLFPYYDIQTLDIVQMPRTPQDLEAFNSTFQLKFKRDKQNRLLLDQNGHPMLDETSMYLLGRLWQLTATRYLLGPAPLLDAINQQFDTVPNRFRIIQRFDLGPRYGADQSDPYGLPGAVPTDNPNAHYALFEYTAALPRAALFSNWQVNTNGQAVLQTMAATNFDASKTVLVSDPLPASAHPTVTNEPAVAATITSYEPADIKIDAEATSPSILMMCDKYDPGWKVWVDGKRSEVLRCNFLMRGVYLEPGRHKVEFKFRPNVKMLYVDMAAIVLGLCLIGYVTFVTRKQSAAGEKTSASSK